MTYNLFISHSWAYSDAYNRLICLLDSDMGFEYKNYSVPKTDPIHNAPMNQAAMFDRIDQYHWMASNRRVTMELSRISTVV